MNDRLDLLARRAATDLGTTTSGDPGAGLSDLHALRTRHRHHLRAAAVAVLVAALAAGWFGRGALSSTKVAPSDTPPTPPAHVTQPGVCHRSGIHCLGHRTFRFALRTPVTWQFPPGFGVAGGGPTTTSVESFWIHRGETAGVTVIDPVVPAAPDSRPAAGFVAGVSPRAFATWLAARPFLVAEAPVRTTVDGRTAWRVRVRLAPGAGEGSGLCAQRYACHPVTVTDPGSSISGIWSDMVADYTFLRLPSGTAVVWSWAFGDDTTALARNHALVDGLSWPGS